MSAANRLASHFELSRLVAKSLAAGHKPPKNSNYLPATVVKVMATFSKFITHFFAKLKPAKLKPTNSLTFDEGPETVLCEVPYFGTFLCELLEYNHLSPSRSQIEPTFFIDFFPHTSLVHECPNVPWSRMGNCKEPVLRKQLTLEKLGHFCSISSELAREIMLQISKQLANLINNQRTVSLDLKLPQGKLMIISAERGVQFQMKADLIDDISSDYHCAPLQNSFSVKRDQNKLHFKGIRQIIDRRAANRVGGALSPQALQKQRARNPRRAISIASNSKHQAQAANGSLSPVSNPRPAQVFDSLSDKQDALSTQDIIDRVNGFPNTTTASKINHYLSKPTSQIDPKENALLNISDFGHFRTGANSRAQQRRKKSNVDDDLLAQTADIFQSQPPVGRGRNTSMGERNVQKQNIFQSKTFSQNEEEPKSGFKITQVLSQNHFSSPLSSFYPKSQAQFNGDQIRSENNSKMRHQSVGAQGFINSSIATNNEAELMDVPPRDKSRFINSKKLEQIVKFDSIQSEKQRRDLEFEIGLQKMKDHARQIKQAAKKHQKVQVSLSTAPTKSDSRQAKTAEPSQRQHSQGSRKLLSQQLKERFQAIKNRHRESYQSQRQKPKISNSFFRPAENADTGSIQSKTSNPMEFMTFSDPPPTRKNKKNTSEQQRLDLKIMRQIFQPAAGLDMRETQTPVNILNHEKPLYLNHPEQQSLNSRFTQGKVKGQIVTPFHTSEMLNNLHCSRMRRNFTHLSNRVAKPKAIEANIQIGKAAVTTFPCERVEKYVQQLSTMVPTFYPYPTEDLRQHTVLKKAHQKVRDSTQEDQLFQMQYNKAKQEAERREDIKFGKQMIEQAQASLLSEKKQRAQQTKAVQIQMREQWEAAVK